MVLRKLMVSIMVIGLAATAWAGIPDLDESTATHPNVGTQLTVYCLPNGQGNGFDEATDNTATVADATITVTLLDINTDPVQNFPSEDLALFTDLGGLVACPGGTVADGNSDANGEAQWQNPMEAGGYTDPASETVNVYVNGAPLNHPGLDVQFNSADISGDGIVNLTDVGIFAGDYYGTYAFRSDFVWDETLNLSDIGVLAQGNGASCP